MTRQTMLLPAALWLSAMVAAAAEPAPEGMAHIPAGEYRPFFRSAGEPVAVPVQAFCLDILPVTRSQFLEFVKRHPQWRRSRVKRIFADGSYLRDWAGDLNPGTNAPGNAPVTYVSWFAARAYAQSLGKRLPTAAEWEYAAAASPTRPDGANDPVFQRQILSWYSTPATRLCAVGASPRNYWGVQDLHGLVWEWVLDFNSAMIASDSRGAAGSDRQFFCGAGALGAKDARDFPAFMRYGFRSSLGADYCVHNLGFRCARSL